MATDTVEKLKTLATIANAVEYGATNDKWLFCHYLIEAELDIKGTDARIEILENLFDAVNNYLGYAAFNSIGDTERNQRVISIVNRFEIV